MKQTQDHFSVFRKIKKQSNVIQRQIKNLGFRSEKSKSLLKFNLYFLKNIKFFLKIIFNSKFIFDNPEKKDVVIFDDVSMQDFKNLIYNYNFFILQCRKERINKIYFSFKIFKLFIKNYKGNSMTAYLISLLEIINPKVVLTNIDNSFKFFDLARILDKKMSFVAIQNATRYDLAEHKDRYKKNLIESDFTERFYIPNFLCFGQLEIDDYKYYKIKVKNFFKVGSLRLANALHHIQKNKIYLKKFSYDICLISEPVNGRDAMHGKEGIEKGYADMAKFTIKFCMQNNMKLVFVWKRNKKLSPEQFKQEINFFKKYLTIDELNYILKNSVESRREEYTSYSSMLQSKVTVGLCSTMLRENLAIGGKILSCNLTPTNIWDFPIQGICSIKDCTYEFFEKRLLDIHSMKEEIYFSKLNKPKNYAIDYDENNSTIDIIKRKIDYFLNSKSSSNS